jgi:hypothetical protein
MYERRFAVYDATRMLLNRAGLYGQVTPEDLGEFYSGIRGAEFLFDGSTRTFIENIEDDIAKEKLGERAYRDSPNQDELQNPKGLDPGHTA